MDNFAIKIISDRRRPLKKRLKAFLLYKNRSKWANKSWEKRHQQVFQRNKDYSKSCENDVELEYKKLWSDFRRKPDVDTLRICKNISGTVDLKMIPEDIFVADIEPTLIFDENVSYLSNKSFYNKWFKNCFFPKDHLHRIEGQYLDRNLNGITFSEFKKIAEQIEFPVVLKPNRDTHGGKGIKFINCDSKLIELAKNSDNFVVQEVIKQDSFFEKFNPYGLNTIRVYLYRSVKDNKLHVLNMAFRMGRDGSLDNETAGGIHTRIRDDGSMNGYAVDKFGVKFLKHPNSNYEFHQIIPNYEGLVEHALRVGSQVFLTRIIGLDVCYDEEEKWRTIEINTVGHTIRFAQYGGQPFFGKFTEEVIEYCKKNHWALK